MSVSIAILLLPSEFQFHSFWAVTCSYHLVFSTTEKGKKISFHIVNKQTSVLLLDSFAIERAVCSFQLFHMKFGEKVWLLHSLFVNCTAFVSLFFLFLFMCTVPSFAIVIYYVWQCGLQFISCCIFAIIFFSRFGFFQSLEKGEMPKQKYERHSLALARFSFVRLSWVCLLSLFPFKS